MNSSEEDDGPTITSPEIERLEHLLDRVSDLNFNIVDIHEAAAKNIRAKHQGITPKQENQARRLIGDDPNTKPVQVIPDENSRDYGHDIKAIGAYREIKGGKSASPYYKFMQTILGTLTNIFSRETQENKPVSEQIHKETQRRISAPETDTLEL